MVQLWQLLYGEVIMDVSILFKIGAIGILVTVISQLFQHQGRNDLATLTGLAGLVIVPVVSLLTPKPDKEKTEDMFSCYNREVTVKSKESLGE